MYFLPRTSAGASVLGEKYMLLVLNYVDSAYVAKLVAKIWRLIWNVILGVAIYIFIIQRRDVSIQRLDSVLIAPALKLKLKRFRAYFAS